MTSSFAADLASMRRRTRSNRSTLSPQGQTQQGAEHDNCGEAEEVALGLAKGQGRTVWYEEESSERENAREEFQGLNHLSEAKDHGGTSWQFARPSRKANH